MKICSICKKISGTENDHLDCLEKRRIELEAGGIKENLTEKEKKEAAKTAPSFKPYNRASLYKYIVLIF